MLATDASGRTALDHGGFGVVARALPPDTLEDLLDKCFPVVRTLSDLSGLTGRLRHPDKELKATKPSTTLPKWLFDNQHWTGLSGGDGAFMSILR
mgnify:CR=1 FL=1